MIISPSPRIRAAVSWMALLAVLLLVSGCAGYKLGPTQGRISGAQSIEIRPFQNKTPEPRLTTSVEQSIRKFLQQDGTFTLETRDEGDIVVEGVIQEFQRSYLSLDPRDVITPRDYRLILAAQITARERSTGKILVDRQVRGWTTIRVGTDSNSAERQAVPLMAESLGRKVASLLTDGDW